MKVITTCSQKFGIAAVMILATNACYQEQEAPQIEFARCDTRQAVQGYKLVQEKLEFQRDILPILSSTRDGAVYKCTVCHAPYSKEETFTEAKLEKVIKVIEDGSMPPRNDEETPVSAADIGIIKRWQAEKYDSLSDPDSAIKPSGDETIVDSDDNDTIGIDVDDLNEEPNPRISSEAPPRDSDQKRTSGC